jgi:hypothetical protein
MKKRFEVAYPMYCDFACPIAEFSDPSAAGACRRDIVVWCPAAEKYNNKHARCLMRPARALAGKHGSSVPAGRMRGR